MTDPAYHISPRGTHHKMVIIDVDDGDKIKKWIGLLTVAQWTGLGYNRHPRKKWCGACK
jgi:hypothetical protein